MRAWSSSNSDRGGIADEKRGSLAGIAKKGVARIKAVTIRLSRRWHRTTWNTEADQGTPQASQRTARSDR